MRGLQGHKAGIGICRTTLAIALVGIATLVRADPLLTFMLKIKGHSLRVEAANDETSRRTGLMFRRELADSRGMVFVYETEERWAMWMRNTYVPLSVAFIDRNGRILNIEDMQPLTDDSHEAVAPAKYALETNLGWFRKRGIKAGDRVQGLDRIPQQP